MEKRSRRLEVVSYFLRLGFLGFGGPLALISVMQKDLVEKRKWVDIERFNQSLAIIKAMPGPIASQIAIHMGRLRGGHAAGFLAGFCLILPAFVLMLLIAAFYTSIESFTWSARLLFGMQAAAIGVIGASVWNIVHPYRKHAVFWTIVVSAGILTYLHPSYEPLIIIGSGILGVLLNAQFRGHSHAPNAVIGTAIGVGAMSRAEAAVAGVVTAGTAAVASLAGIAVKAGAFTFGSGLAIVPLLVHDVVHVHHWLTHAQFMDALAFGQITPGPVIITVTFIGYKVAGLAGAIVATVAVFAPSFFNMLTWFPYAEGWLSRSPRTKVFVMWAIGAVAGSIIVAVARLLGAPSAAGTHLESGILATATLALAIFSPIPAWALIPIGGAITALIRL